MVLVTLGACHLLDGLVACDSIDAREKIVRFSGEGFVRGIVLTPRGSRRATSVSLSYPLLWVGSYGARGAGLAGDAN